MGLLFFIGVAIVFLTLLMSIKDKSKALIIIALFLFYVTLIIAEQVYLECQYGLKFHLSDATEYYRNVKFLSLYELDAMLISEPTKSNSFYFYLNWFFLNDFGYQLFPVFIKITNVMAFLIAYLLLTMEQRGFKPFHFFILLHPYLLTMIVRNLRDTYIILLLAVFLFLMERRRLNLFYYTIAGIASGMMITIRAFFLALYGLLLLERVSIFFNKYKKQFVYTACFLALAFLWVFRVEIIQQSASVYLSIVMSSDGPMGDNQEMYKEIMYNGGTISDLLSDASVRIFKGFFVFLLTPHPFNYLVKYMQLSRNGIWGIYTDFDNILICIGSCLTYLVILPLFIKYVVNFRKIDIKYHLVNFFIIIMYTIYQLGITDTRIKYTLMFFLVISFHKSGLHFGFTRQDKGYFIASIALLIGLSLVSV
jgi:hypothetical protein